MFIRLDKKLCVLSNAVRIASANFLEVWIHPYILVNYCVLCQVLEVWKSLVGIRIRI